MEMLIWVGILLATGIAVRRLAPNERDRRHNLPPRHLKSASKRLVLCASQKKSPHGGGLSKVLLSDYPTRGETTRRMLLSDLQILRRFLALVGNNIVFDVCALIKRTQSSALNSRDMHEHVLATALRLDEPIAFGWVEPFHSACSHVASPFAKFCRGDEATEEKTAALDVPEAAPGASIPDIGPTGPQTAESALNSGAGADPPVAISELAPGFGRNLAVRD
jgi:hypothetical protein